MLVTFGGNAGMLMLPDAIRQLHVHVVALRDPKRCFALCGIPGLGDTYGTCVQGLLAIKAALRAENTFCCGNSAGGFAALRYSLDLSACGVMGLCAPTTLNIADDPGAPMSRYPQLATLYRHLPDIPLDMAQLYAATLPRPRVVLFYSPSNARDTWLATRMAGIEGVVINTVPDEAGHRILEHVRI